MEPDNSIRRIILNFINSSFVGRFVNAYVSYFEFMMRSPEGYAFWSRSFEFRIDDWRVRRVCIIVLTIMSNDDWRRACIRFDVEYY